MGQEPPSHVTPALQISRDPLRWSKRASASSAFEKLSPPQDTVLQIMQRSHSVLGSSTVKVAGLSVAAGTCILAVQQFAKWLGRDNGTGRNARRVHLALTRSGIQPGELVVVMDNLKETPEILQGSKRLGANCLVFNHIGNVDEETLQVLASMTKIFVYSQFSQDAVCFQNALDEKDGFSLSLCVDGEELSNRNDSYHTWLTRSDLADSSNESVKASKVSSEDDFASDRNRQLEFKTIAATSHPQVQSIEHKDKRVVAKRAEHSALRAAPPPLPRPEPGEEGDAAAGQMELPASHAADEDGNGEGSVGLMVKTPEERGEEGVEVTKVLPGEWAAREGSIRTGDRLRTLNGCSIAGPDHLSDLLAAYAGATLIFAVQRHQGQDSLPFSFEVVLSSDTRPGFDSVPGAAARADNAAGLEPGT